MKFIINLLSNPWFLMLPLYFLQTNLYSQSITTNDLAMFKVDAEDRIRILGDNLNRIASKTTSPSVKKFVVEETLKLFLNKGEGITIETSTLKNGQELKKTHTLRKYLENLASLPYAEVDLTFAESIYVSSWYPVGNGTYKATGYFQQMFMAKKTSGGYSHTYGDITNKTVDLLLKMGEDFYGKTYAVYLGNIRVKDTHSSNNL